MKIELTSVFKKGILIGLVFWVSFSFGQIDKVWTIENIAGSTGSTSFTPGASAMGNGFQVPGAIDMDKEGNIYFGVASVGAPTDAAVYRIDRLTSAMTKLPFDASGISGLTIDREDNILYYCVGFSIGASPERLEYIYSYDLTTGISDTIAGNGLNNIPPIEESSALGNPIGNAGGIKIDPTGEFLYYSSTIPMIEATSIPNYIQKIIIATGTTKRVLGNNDLIDAPEVENATPIWDLPVTVGLGLAWDSNGDLYFTDRYNSIKKIKDGIIYDVVGIGSEDGGDDADGVPAKEALLDFYYSGFVITENDVLFLCDDNNNKIRRVQLTPNIEDDIEYVTTVCGTGDNESDGDDSKDLLEVGFRLAKETNIQAYDMLINEDSLVFTDGANRLRQVFICTYPEITEITVTPETICVGDSVTLSVNGDLNNADTWNWYLSDECSSTEMPYGHSESIKVLVENDFDISVSASGGCVFTQECLSESFELNCKEYYNTFTPNGDGKNDVFEISTVQNYPLNTVSIYNRWGVLLNKIENYDNETNVWTGTNEGDVAVGSGTYFFTLESAGETIISGWIELIK